MLMRRVFPASMVILLVACAPSKEAMSAGQVGCVESEIEISDESFSFGSSESWVATCNGVRYICARVITGAMSGPGNQYGSNSQVNCTEEKSGSSDESEAARPAENSPAETAAAAPQKSTVPAGAGGFQFGQSRVDAESACAAGSFEFSPSGDDGAVCSGLPTKLGFKASAELKLCNDKVCEIALVADPALSGSMQMKSFAALAEALTKKYGPPYERKTTLPAECRSQGAEECLNDGRVDLQHVWRWPAVSISLTLNKPESGDRARLAIQYRQLKKSTQLDSDAL